MRIQRAKEFEKLKQRADFESIFSRIPLKDSGQTDNDHAHDSMVKGGKLQTKEEHEGKCSLHQGEDKESKHHGNEP